jgi:hypothetical protein
MSLLIAEKMHDHTAPLWNEGVRIWRDLLHQKHNHVQDDHVPLVGTWRGCARCESLQSLIDAAAARVTTA